MRKQKILCAMSGGVDSSVAALLLKKKGFEVVGLFFKFWVDSSSFLCKEVLENKCCSEDSKRAAREVAQKLNIKLYTINLERQFKKEVVDYFLEEYENGRTPNPCVVCNQMIKFGQLTKIAAGLGIKKVATGHHARIKKDDRSTSLHRGKDLKKDQSYFLWRLRPDLLKICRFPVGEYKKPQIRKIAKKFKLESANRLDSRGLCFIGKTNTLFLKKYAKTLLEPGNVVTKQGEIIGTHQGLARYTIGQRMGFKIKNNIWQKEKKDMPPLYVIRLNLLKNELAVGEESEIFSKKFTIIETNWLDGEAGEKAQKQGLRALAQIRYLHTADSCSIKTKSNQTIVTYKKRIRAITPGQSCVFYTKSGKVLGGGIIDKIWQE